MRIYVRSLIDFARCVVELVEVSVAPKSTVRRWTRHGRGLQY